MIDLQTISVIIAASGVTMASIYYIMNLRNTIRTRQAQLFMQIYNKWMEPEATKRYIEVMNWEGKEIDDFLENFSPSNLDSSTSFRKIGRFFEGVGVLVKRRLIDVGLVDDLMSGTILRYWEKYESIVTSMRELEQ